MQSLRVFARRVAPHMAALGRVSGTVGLVVGGYATAVYLYVETHWKGGNCRIYDPPKWENYTLEQRQEIVEKRHRLVETMRDLYQMDKNALEDATTSELFMEDCVFEDPRCRRHGTEEILRAFNGLSEINEYIKFTTFEPTHYENMVIIKCEREYLLNGNMMVFNPDGPKQLKSNLVIHLEKDNQNRERMKYIIDEWNYVYLLQPESHNVYAYAGSLAKAMRRVQGKLTFYYMEKEKSITNPFFIHDKRDDVIDFAKRKYEGVLEDAESKPMKLEQEMGIVFNASQTKMPASDK